MTPQDAPSAAEWKVLKVVADAGEVATRDVVRLCAARFGWAASTVKTLLRRLTDKGLLRARRVGNTFVHRPTRSVRRSLFQAAEALLENAAEGTVAPLLAHMVRKSRLSPDELAELRAWLDAKDDAEERT